MSKKSALLACLSSILMVLMFIDGSVTSAAPVLYEFKESNSVMDFIHVYNEHTKYNGLKVDTKTNSISIENCMQINNRKSKKIASGSTIGKKESMSHSIPVSDLKFKHLFNDINLKNTALNTGLDIEWPNQCDFHGDKYDAYVVIVKGKNNRGKSVLSIFTDRTNRVYKMTISAEKSDRYSVNSAFKMEKVILYCLGLSDIIVAGFLNDMRNSPIPHGQAVWVESSNRNLIVEHMLSPKLSSLFYIRISAIDKRL